MATSYGFSTYQAIIEDVRAELNEENRLAAIQPELFIKWILQASQQICERKVVREYVKLRLIQDQEEYEFADTDTPVTGSGTVSTTLYLNTLTGTLATGTGTISSSGSTVTGVGTAFATELAVGVAFVADSQTLTVMRINSNTECILSGGFTSDLAAGTSFQYSNTKFGRELSIGSVVTIGANSGTILTITSPYQAVFSAFFNATNSAQTFTIDRKVTEIPTKIDRVESVSRLDTGYTLTPSIVDIVTLRRMQRDDGVGAGYVNLQRPMVAAPWVNASGRRVLIVYPTAEVDKDITLYGIIRIRPDFYTTSTTSITSTVPLESQHDGAVREYVKWRCLEWLKDFSRSRTQRDEFELAVRRLVNADPVPLRIQIDTD